MKGIGEKWKESRRNSIVQCLSYFCDSKDEKNEGGKNRKMSEKIRLSGGHNYGCCHLLRVFSSPPSIVVAHVHVLTRELLAHESLLPLDRELFLQTQVHLSLVSSRTRVHCHA